MDTTTIVDPKKFKLKTKLFKTFTKGKIYQISLRYFRCKFRVTGVVLGDYKQAVNIEVIEGEYFSVNDTWRKVNPLCKSTIIQCNKRIRHRSTGIYGNMDCVNGGLNLHTLSKMIGLDYNLSHIFRIDRIVWKKNK